MRAEERWPWVEDILKLLVAIALASFNPFGWKDATDTLSRDLMFSLTAGFYDLRPAATQPVGVAVTITDDSLAATDQIFPPTPDFFADLLYALYGFQPKAIFIDIAFIDRRPGIEKLIDAIDYAKQPAVGPIPVILAATARDIDETNRSSSYECREDVQIDVLASAETAASVFPAETAPGRYQLRLSPCRAKNAQGITYGDSPALEMFKRYCKNEADHPDGCKELTPAAFTKSLVLRLGSAPPELFDSVRRNNEQRYKEHIDKQQTDKGSADKKSDNQAPICDLPAKTTAEAFAIFWQRLITGITQPDILERHGRMLCRPFQTIPTVYFLSHRTQETKAAGEFGLDDLKDYAQQNITGKYVFLGSELNLLNDLAPMPWHGEQPGVLQHLAAFDNLVTYGDGYFSPWPDVIFGLGLDDVVEFAILGMLIAAHHWREYRSPSRRNSPVLYFVAGSGFFASLVLLTTFYWKLEPVNWVGLLALSLIFTEGMIPKIAHSIGTALAPPVKYTTHLNKTFTNKGIQNPVEWRRKPKRKSE